MFLNVRPDRRQVNLDLDSQWLKNLGIANTAQFKQLRRDHSAARKHGQKMAAFMYGHSERLPRGNNNLSRGVNGMDFAIIFKLDACRENIVTVLGRQDLGNVSVRKNLQVRPVQSRHEICLRATIQRHFDVHSSVLERKGTHAGR